MADWYDYVPLAGSIKRLSEGNLKQAAIDFIPGAPLVQDAYNAYTGAIDTQKQGLENAAAQSRAEAERRRQFAMEGLGKAQAFYEPAQKMVKAAYGSPEMLRK